MTGSNISMEPSWSGRQAFIGCRAFPTLDCVREAIAITGDSFRAFEERPPDRFDHWNLAVLHVIWHQQFAIGARSSRQLYIESSGFNTKSGLARLTDKDNKNGYKSRLVWMPPALVCQMKELDKARYFIDPCRVGRPRHLPFGEITFDSDTGLSESISRKGIIRVSKEFFPFPANTPRRVMRYLLKNRGLSPEYVDVFMGHWRERREPWGKWSSLDYSDYLACLRQLVPEILSDLGFVTRPAAREQGNVSKTKLNKIIWDDPSALCITDKQLPAFERLKQILLKSKLPAAKLLCEGRDAKWTPQDLSDIEAELNTKISTMLNSEAKCRSEVDAQEHLADELKNTFDCLAKIVDRIVNKVGYEAPRPRYVSRIRLETNPFKDDLSDAERKFDVLRQLVRKARETRPSEPNDMIALALLSAIAQFQLLHMDLQVAWFEALTDRSNNTLAFKNRVECIELQVQWGNQPNAERRLYIPDRNTRRLISQIKDADVTDILEGIRGNHHQSSPRSNTAKKTSRNGKSIYKFLQKTVDEYIAARSVSDVKLKLPDVTRAARTLVYLHVPAAVAAYRRRTTISHAPRMAVLRRILSGVPVTGDTTPPIIPKKPQASVKLSRIAGRYGSTGSRMAEFAQHLLKSHAISTASRFSLLISRRLGCRQEKQTEFDPAGLPVPQLESLYEEILEEDWDNVTPETQEDEIRRDKRMTVLAILKFHQFLEAVCKVGKLDELKDRLNPNGLLPVDANFITIDEYRCVLRYIDGDTNLNDPYIRKALQLFVSLCFWGGLRRDEALGLRVSDLDPAGHLHIRPYAKRKLKTSNANRSLPVATLLPKELFEEVAQWAKERAHAPRSRAVALFFSRQDDASILLPPKAVYSKIIASMRDSLGDQSLKIHHLRHSFATLLAAKLLPHMETFPSRLFARHPETIEWLKDREAFRRKLFLTDQMRGADLQGIAHLLGHGSPGTSVEHYLHCFDWCLPTE